MQQPDWRGRGARRPAIEPRKKSSSGCRRVSDRGRQHGRARERECPDGPAWSETLACADALCAGTGRSRVRPMTQSDVGPQREGEELTPLMHGREKSDPAIVCACQLTCQVGRSPTPPEAPGGYPKDGVMPHQPKMT